MDDITLTPDDIQRAQGYTTLGPAYFTARRMAEALMQGAEAEPLKKVVTKVTQEIRDELYEYVEDHFRSDLEMNLQGYIRDTVERTVEALLTGQEWAMQQYPLAPYARGEEVRKAVAQHGGDGLLKQRIQDLEKENARLQEQLKWARERY